MSASGRSIYWDDERPGAVTPEGVDVLLWLRDVFRPSSGAAANWFPLDLDRLIGDCLPDVMDWRPRTPDQAAARAATLRRVLEATLGTPGLVLHADTLAILRTEFPDVASPDARRRIRPGPPLRSRAGRL